MKVLKKEVIVRDDEVDCVATEKDVLAIENKVSFLVQLHAVFQSVDRIFFVLEYLQGGDLMYHIQKEGVFNEPRATFYTAEILIALDFLHGQFILYRDLKLDNVMLDISGHIKITDFGMCKKLDSIDGTTLTLCGTPDYIAPEIIQQEPYSYSVDFWALGILVYEMVVGAPPFDGHDEDELFHSILEAPVQYPRTLSRETQAFIRGLLTRDVKSRLGCLKQNVKINPQTISNKQVYTNGIYHLQKHPYFRMINWDMLIKKEIQPTFIPEVKNDCDVTYFDKSFTTERKLKFSRDGTQMSHIDQSLFKNFNQVTSW